ncbi:threonine-type endopeptidase, partial [Perkinsus sp. BL_2016]
QAESIATGYGAHLAQPLLRDAIEMAKERNSPLTEQEAFCLIEKCMKVLYYRDARSIDKNSKTSEINFFTFLFKMEKLSLFVVSLALLILGLWEVVTWPNWALSESALLLLLGSVFNQIYALAELSSATAFAIFGLFGVYFSAVGGSSLSHKLTGRFEVLMILPLLVLYTSAVAFMIIGSELMAHNAPLTAIIGRLWSWRYKPGTIAPILLRLLAQLFG